jgi:hypothetical protein
MSLLDKCLDGNRVAISEMIAAAHRCESHWTVPRAPGKWSPSRVTEHVARTLDESAKLILGEAVRFPAFPAFLRPIVRGLLFQRVLKKGTFPKAKTNKPFDPERGPDTPSDAATRLEGARDNFERACRACRDGEPVPSKTFGPVSLADYVRFQEIHVRHHTTQLKPGA